jgi:1-acyl-sn-glycerol-3-phosphate acyltransferase
MRVIVSIAIWVAGFVITAANLLASVILRFLPIPLRNRDRLVHSQCFWWSDALISLNPFWKLRVEGLENIVPGRTYVITANHQSLADIIIIYQMKIFFKWVAKEELLKVPLIGALLWVNNHILVARDEMGSIKDAFRKAADYIAKGVPMLFFPEGTRSDTDEMGEFKNGAFKLAIKMKAPVLPVYLGGTREAIPKGGWIFKAKVNGILKVLPAIETSGMQTADFEALRDKVRSQLQAVAAETAQEAA